ncbi:MAG: leucine-rich repeat protein, partial [Clostridia bacterium]|nr:leucine-rich repeat protein [Clostridia bacterium]
MKSVDKLKLAFIDADIKTFGDTKPYDGWEQSGKYISARSALIKKRSSHFFGLLSEPWKKAAAAAVLVIAAVVAFVIFKNGFGNEKKNGSFSYQVLEDRTLEITSYTGDSEDVTVPEEIDGGVVTKIKSMSSNAAMKSVTLPETLTVIESNAFKGCKYLSVVSIPKSVGVIGSGAFEGCDSLKTVYFSGTDAEWKMIEISNGNIELYSAEMRFFNETTLPLPVTSQAEVSSCSEIPSETKTRPSFSEAKHTDAVTVSKAETTELS